MIATCGGVGVSEDAAALVGARSREENEAWAMTIVQVAHFGSGMIQTEARMAGLRASLAVGSASAVIAATPVTRPLTRTTGARYLPRNAEGFGAADEMRRY